MSASRRESGAGWSVAQAAGRPLWRLRAGHARERTENISRISVTRDVSQLDMSALNCDWAWAKPEKSPFIFVIAETSQLEIGPYVAVAESASSL